MKYQFIFQKLIDRLWKKTLGKNYRIDKFIKKRFSGNSRKKFSNRVFNRELFQFYVFNCLVCENTINSCIHFQKLVRTVVFQLDLMRLIWILIDRNVFFVHSVGDVTNHAFWFSCRDLMNTDFWMKLFLQNMSINCRVSMRIRRSSFINQIPQPWWSRNKKHFE